MVEEQEEETTTSPRRSSVSSAASPEFSFWPSSSLANVTPETNVSSADDLFSNGVLLPTLPPEPESDKEIEPKPDSPSVNPSSIVASSSAPTPSKRWKDIFKATEKEKTKEKTKPSKNEETKNRIKTHKTGQTGPAGSTEISINIWPFGRSRSAGTGGSCRKPTGVNPVRKSSSAPCSRSNSRGESKPGLVNRTGIHVGRSSPVWQVKRNKPAEPVKISAGSARVINLSVNSCIGYGRIKEVRCGGENKERVFNVTGGDRNGGLFGIKGLFSKKVH